MTEPDRESIIEEFETAGFATFRIGEEQEEYEALMAYVRKNAVPIHTNIDKRAGVIAVQRRPWGTLEFG